ncbi:MAG: lyase family protein [Gaiellaceae bacterium]
MPFEALFVPDALRAAVSDEAWVRAMVEAERALLLVQFGEHLPQVEVDPEQLARDARRVGNPAEPLVRRLREAAGEHVHHGATSQDVLDTASMLVARDAVELILAELERAAGECARLAETHRGTVMPARTLLQQAVPTTFGLKAAGWLVGLCEARLDLSGVDFEAQLGGAAGTLAAFGDGGLELLRRYADELGLAEPTLPWHASRTRIAQLGASLDLAAGACAKVALDVELLAQTEVGEVREPAEGGSSTMPHKRNPVGSTLARACAAGVHAAACVLTGGVHEHERAAGAWHAEWKALSDALALTGGAAAWIAETLAGLEVDADRMRANLSAGTLSEAERFAPGTERPEDYLGAADALIDRALDLYRETV